MGPSGAGAREGSGRLRAGAREGSGRLRAGAREGSGRLRAGAREGSGRLRAGAREGSGRLRAGAGKGTLPSRRRPWQAEAAAERAGLGGRGAGDGRDALSDALHGSPVPGPRSSVQRDPPRPCRSAARIHPARARWIRAALIWGPVGGPNALRATAADRVSGTSSPGSARTCVVPAGGRPNPRPIPRNPRRPGRLVAASACPGRHETPGTAHPQLQRPRSTPPIPGWCGANPWRNAASRTRLRPIPRAAGSGGSCR